MCEHGLPAGELLGKRQELQYEQTNGDPNKEGASKIEQDCDEDISSGVFYFCRL